MALLSVVTGNRGAAETTDGVQTGRENRSCVSLTATKATHPIRNLQNRQTAYRRLGMQRTWTEAPWFVPTRFSTLSTVPDYVG